MIYCGKFKRTGGKLKTKHEKLNHWVKKMAEMCQPDRIVLIDGSEAEKLRLEQESFATGELIHLDQEKLPGCIYHRTNPNDVARTEHLTYICTRSRSTAGPTNNWMSSVSAYKKASAIFRGAMKGRTMYVIPFSMGPIGSNFSKIGVQLTDSIYVVLNMRIMTRIGEKVLATLGTDGEFTKCLHSKADLDPNRRLILHFPEDNTIWSVGSGYGGNVLLGKKCLSLRIASYLGWKEGWMAEHMFIMGVERPNGQIQYIAGAFPSACGKTNLAMLVPPEGLKAKGYRIWTLGDDIAWMRIDSDGALWAVNPETGFFGVAPGTNVKTNPNAMATIRKNTIFTNVFLKPDRTVWWEEIDDSPPASGTNWEGKPWKPGMKDADGKPVRAAHPNSRFTAPILQCPSASFRLEQHHGVPISAILFGGRRAHLAPLVYESFNWQHGVYVGATMASEITAAQYGRHGELRRDPMAMLPFCGYHIGKYFRHWLQMGKKMTSPPKIFHVNWFRTDEKGEFLWPGYGENIRVLEWILERCNNTAEAKITPIGFVPTERSLDMTDIALPAGNLEKLLEVDKEAWKNELISQKEFFNKLGKELPDEIIEEHAALAKRLK